MTNLEDILVLKKGGIHIKKKNRGKFIAAAKRAGMGVQEFARHVLANKDKYSSTLVKRANFARNSKKFKHQDGGIIKAQDGTGKGFWSKLWNALTENGLAARDAKIGAVGAQQVRDLYSEGKNQEARDLTKKYIKANTTGIALGGGAASTSILGDLLVTGTTTGVDTFIDGNAKDFGKNLAKNITGDLIGRRIEKYIKPAGDLFESSMFQIFQDPGTIYISNGKSGILKINPSKYAQRILNGGGKRTGIPEDLSRAINKTEPIVLTRFDEQGRRLPIQDFRFWPKRSPDVRPDVPNDVISIPDNNVTLNESMGDVFDVNTGKLTSKSNYVGDLNKKLTDNEKLILIDHEASHLVDRRTSRKFDSVDFISGNYISNPSEVHARISQAKTAAGITNGSKKFTGEEFRRMFWDYIISGKVDNQMSKFYVNVTDWNKLANWANKFVPGIGTAVLLNDRNE